jgi:hypothetical protein
MKKIIVTGLKLLAYAAMLAAICVFFSGGGAFIYEGF